MDLTCLTLPSHSAAGPVDLYHDRSAQIHEHIGCILKHALMGRCMCTSSCEPLAVDPHTKAARMACAVLLDASPRSCLCQVSPSRPRGACCQGSHSPCEGSQDQPPACSDQVKPSQVNEVKPSQVKSSQVKSTKSSQPTYCQEPPLHARDTHLARPTTCMLVV